MKTFLRAILFLLLLLGASGATLHAATIAEDLHARIAADLRSSLQGDIELQETHFLPAMDPALLHDCQITQLVQSGYGGRNRVNYLVSLQNRKTGQTFSLQAEAIYDLFVEIMVTSRAVKKGDVLSSQDYNVIRQRSSRLPVGAALSADEVNGRPVRMNLAEGVVVKRDHVLPSGHVSRGQKVKIEIESGSIIVTAPGVLRRGGMVGNMVKVYCDTSKREIQGMLIAPDLVRVKS